MKTVEIIGFKRANLGKKESKALRNEANVPCVLYGGKEQVHFFAPMILFRDLVYTPDAHMVDLNIEGSLHKCILQDIQFHPVSEMILHADFLELKEDKPVKMDIPVKLVGNAVGVQKGGKLTRKLTKLTVKALPKHMPDYIEADISSLDLGKSLRVSDVQAKSYTILNTPSVTVASVVVPRALKGKEEQSAEAAAAKS